jgi:hypothetical protein
MKQLVWANSHTNLSYDRLMLTWNPICSANLSRIIDAIVAVKIKNIPLT